MSAVSASLTSEVTAPPTCEQEETGCPTLYLRGMAVKTSVSCLIVTVRFDNLAGLLRWHVVGDELCVTFTLVTLVNSLSIGWSCLPRQRGYP